jgi:hypothetical protein
LEPLLGIPVSSGDRRRSYGPLSGNGKPRCWPLAAGAPQCERTIKVVAGATQSTFLERLYKFSIRVWFCPQTCCPCRARQRPLDPRPALVSWSSRVRMPIWLWLVCRLHSSQLDFRRHDHDRGASNSSSCRSSSANEGHYRSRTSASSDTIAHAPSLFLCKLDYFPRCISPPVVIAG